MKITRLLIAMALLAGFGFAFTSCKEDDDDNTTTQANQITYNGVNYAIDKVAAVRWFKKATGYNYALVFISPGGQFHTTGSVIDSLSGTGTGIAFDVYSADSNGIAAGNYVFDSTWSGDAGTLGYVSMVMNYNFSTDEGDDVEFVGGTLTAKKSGSDTEFTYSGKDAMGKTMSFYYKGVVKVYYDGMKSKNIWRQ
jgi:hypothetical protein